MDTQLRNDARRMGSTFWCYNQRGGRGELWDNRGSSCFLVEMPTPPLLPPSQPLPSSPQTPSSQTNINITKKHNHFPLSTWSIVSLLLEGLENYFKCHNRVELYFQSTGQHQWKNCQLLAVCFPLRVHLFHALGGTLIYFGLEQLVTCHVPHCGENKHSIVRKNLCLE